ncbi:MAG: response regulator transcription factor [Chloroflexota bacterium]
MSTNTILIVEDDRTLVDVLRYNLVKEGYNVLIAGDGEGALKLTRTEKPDLILLDIMLPRMSGLEVCRILRKETNVPILMLTARTDEIDKVVGLEVGADDYVIKPFSLRELMARVRAMLRRAEMTAPKPSDRQSVKVGDLQVDVARRKVTLGNSVLDLTQKEFDLLTFLAQNKGLVFSREQLLDKVWGYEFAGDTRTVDVHIRWLRQKIETDPAHPERLVTVRGVGYKLEE